METVGALLRAERERKGLTIKDIEQGTSIRALYLTAIEEDRYEVIPGEVYLKGFIRNYANFLGMNGQQIVDVYRESRSDFEAPKDELPVQPKRSTQEKLKSQRNSSSSIKWVAFAAVILLGLGITAYSLMKPSNQPLTQQESTKQSSPQQTPVAQQPAPAAAPSDKPIAVLAKFSEDCWVSVTADGKVIYEATAKSNEQFTWNAQKSLTIRAGNAGAVDITYNNQPQGKLGNKGQIAEKTFTVSANQPKS